MNSLVLHIETWASAVIIHLQISCSCSSLSWADLSLFDHLKFWASDIWLQKKPRSRITRLLKFIIVRISLKMQDHCHERWLRLNSSKILIIETQDQTISCPLQAITISHTWSVLWRQVQWTLRIIKYLSSLTCPVFADIFAPANCSYWQQVIVWRGPGNQTTQSMMIIIIITVVQSNLSPSSANPFKLYSPESVCYNCVVSPGNLHAWLILVSDQWWPVLTTEII